MSNKLCLLPIRISFNSGAAFEISAMLQNQCRRDCCFHHSNVVVQDQWRHKRLLWKVSTSDEPSCFDNGGSKSEWRLNRAQPPAGVRTLTNTWSRNEFQAQKVNTRVVRCRMLKQVLEECVRLMLFLYCFKSKPLFAHWRWWGNFSLFDGVFGCFTFLPSSDSPSHRPRWLSQKSVCLSTHHAM